jgi:hypothetical protein
MIEKRILFWLVLGSCVFQTPSSVLQDFEQKVSEGDWAGAVGAADLLARKWPDSPEATSPVLSEKLPLAQASLIGARAKGSRGGEEDLAIAAEAKEWGQRWGFDFKVDKQGEMFILKGPVYTYLEEQGSPELSYHLLPIERMAREESLLQDLLWTGSESLLFEMGDLPYREEWRSRSCDRAEKWPSWEECLGGKDSGSLQEARRLVALCRPMAQAHRLACREGRGMARVERIEAALEASRTHPCGIIVDGVIDTIFKDPESVGDPSDWLRQLRRLSSLGDKLRYLYRVSDAAAEQARGLELEIGRLETWLSFEEVIVTPARGACFFPRQGRWVSFVSYDECEPPLEWRIREPATSYWGPPKDSLLREELDALGRSLSYLLSAYRRVGAADGAFEQRALALVEADKHFPLARLQARQAGGAIGAKCRDPEKPELGLSWAEKEVTSSPK